MPAEAWVALVGVVLGVIAYLLDRKDRQQERALDEQKQQIELLFKKHDEDAKRLQEVELDIAKRHYVKEELDSKFERLEAAIKSTMTELGGKFDKLADILIHRGAGQ